MLALTRAEIIERMRAPVLTQAEGLVAVYADCPEDMRREFQSPIGRFAADTAETLYRGLSQKPVRFHKPGIVIHVGDVRTNDTTVTTRVVTNDARTISRIYVRSPGHADLERLKLEIIKAFYRSVKAVELTDDGAVDAYRAAVPRLRIEDERWKLEEWLAGRGKLETEDALLLMRKVIEPGVASRRDVLTFASRLFLYPMYFDERFLHKYDCLSFRDAIRLVRQDPRIALMALLKVGELPVLAGGRGEKLRAAAEAYVDFLKELARCEKSEDELKDMLEGADAKLSLALEGAK